MLDAVETEWKNKLAGPSKLEMLIFSLGGAALGEEKVFGVDVFKVRGVMRAPATMAPSQVGHANAKGVVSLREMTVPVVDLAELLGIGPLASRQALIVADVSGSPVGFMVSSIVSIAAVSMSDMSPAPGEGPMVESVADMGGGRLLTVISLEAALGAPTRGLADVSA